MCDVKLNNKFGLSWNYVYKLNYKSTLSPQMTLRDQDQLRSPNNRSLLEYSHHTPYKIIMEYKII